MSKPSSSTNGSKAAPPSSVLDDVAFGEEEEKLFNEVNREIQEALLRADRIRYSILDPVFKKRNATLREKIPKLWPGAILQHGPLSLLVSQPGDQEALSYLRDVTVIRDEREPRAFKIDFEFDENPFFTDKVLTKAFTYTGTAKATPPEEVTAEHLDFDPELHINAESTTINWKPGKSLTEAFPRPKDEEGDSMESGSFFHFFEVADDDYEIAQLIVEDVYPDVTEYFIGRGEHGMDDMDEDVTDDDEEEDEEEEDEIDLEAPPKKRKRTQI